MELTEIIYRLFAWVRPLLWYYHRLGHFVRIAIRCLEDDETCLWLIDNPSARARFEAMLVDSERCLEIALGLRVREILGLPMPAGGRIGLRGRHRIHTPTDILRLAHRLDRLVDRYNDIERLAQLRAARLKREMEAAPVLLIPDHRPWDARRPALSPSPFFQIFRRRRFSVFFMRAAASAPASQRIRAPPWLTRLPIADCPLPRFQR